jgi:DNA-binding NarL/FixJ family response regulator
MSGAATDHAVRILLMDNQRLFASAIHAKLEQDPRFEIVAVASDGHDAVRLADEAKPDVVLVDTECRTAETLSATRQISDSGQTPRVLILAGREDTLYAAQAHDAGAAAFLRRPRAAAELLETLELATVLIGATVPPAEPPINNERCPGQPSAASDSSGSDSSSP